MEQLQIIGRHFLFWSWLFLGMIQFPTAIGNTFLMMAVLVAPYRPLRRISDYLLELWDRRGFVVMLLMMHIYCMPMAEIERAGRQVGILLSKVLRILGFYS